jgi:hypothetical protein
VSSRALRSFSARLDLHETRFLWFIRCVQGPVLASAAIRLTGRTCLVFSDKCATARKVAWQIEAVPQALQHPSEIAEKRFGGETRSARFYRSRVTF